jgi:hypothetical protein
MSRVRVFTALVAFALAAAALGVVSMPAQADNIVTNQWYTAGFGGVGSPLTVPPTFLGTDGPILPCCPGADAVAAPGSGNLSAVITLPNGGFLTVTDVEHSGDRFMMDVNGIGATAAVGNPIGLIPPGAQAVGSLTSVPLFPGAQCMPPENISCGLTVLSSGTFVLPAGTDTISGTVVAGGASGPEGGPLENVDMNFIVEPKPAPATIPEPASWILLSSALLGFGVARRRNRSA